nr:CHAT domain-containing protein [Rhodohalobacter sp. 614A]
MAEWIENCISSKIYLSDIARRNRDFKTAENTIAEAEKFSVEELTRPHPLEVRVYRQKVYLFVDMTDFERAREAANQALELAGSDGLDEISRARAFIAPAYLEEAVGNFQKSFEYYSAAVESIQHLEGNREILRLLALTYNNMGILLRRLGKADEAMGYYQKALQVTTSLYGENHPEMGLLYNNIGAIHYGLGDYGQAADHFLKAASIFRDNYGENHARVAGGYNNAGVAYMQMKDLEKAAEILERAQRIKEETLGENHMDTAIGYSNLASIYRENKEYDAALENIQKSLRVRKKIYGEDHPDLISPYIQFGEFYTEIENFSLARDQYQEALRIAESRLGENHPDVWEVILKLGDTYEEQKEYDQARENYLQAYEKIATTSGIQPNSNFDAGRLSHPLHFLRAAKKVGDMNIQQFEEKREVMHLHQAVDNYSKAMKIVDFLQHSYQSEASKLNLIDENYSIFTNTIKAYHKLYEATGNEAWLNEILRVSELSRSRIALELLQDMEAKTFAGVPDDILEEEQSINTKIADYYQQLHAEQEKGFEASQDIISAYRDSLFESRQKLTSLTEDLEENYRDYYQLKYDRSFADRKTVSNLLDDDETLVNYVVSEDEIYALVLDKRNISFHTLGTPDFLSAQIKTLREAVSANNREEYSAVAHQLYQQLVEPLLPEIKSQSLIIVPDQMLFYLPFEMLLTEQSNDANYYRMPFLLRDLQISYVPSATVLQMLEEQKVEDPRNLFAVAPFNETAQFEDQAEPSRYLSGLSPLPLTQYETREIANVFEESQSFWNFFSPEKTEILLGRNATKSAIENTSFDDYGFIHFATHAFVNEDDPALSGIAFWKGENDDGIIYVNDIYNMNLNADLVTLGACETGLGTVYKGEGMIGFTRAFIYAGAANLMVSMWRVNDQPTARLMIQFYEYARDGHSYSESLQMAKMDLISQPEFASPRNWAAFVLQGR